MTKKPDKPSDLSRSDNKSFNNSLLNYEDKKEAEELRRKKTQNDLDIKYGSEKEALSFDLEQDEKALQASDKKGEQLQTELDRTPPKINTASKFADNPDDKPIPFMAWPLRHRITFILLSFLIVLITGAGGISVYVNLIGSGNPAFIQMPWAAALMAIIPAVGTVSSKCFYHLLHHYRSRFIYAVCVYLLAFFSLSFWVYLFSEQFTGLGGGFDLDSMSEAGKYSGLFVRVQIAAELLCGAALFIMLDNISSLFSGDWSMENLHYTALEKRLEKHKQTHAVLVESVKQKRGRMKELNAIYESAIQDDMNTFISLRSRH